MTMNPEQNRRVEALFDRLCDLPLEEAITRLEKECADDDAVRKEVARLLASAAATQSTLNDQLQQVLGAALDKGLGTTSVPEQIGPYKILRTLGEGGMGTVYEAEQQSPKRIVALKVIRAGFVRASLLRRFEHEAQILGKLDHPGIATIFEAGTFDGGAGPQPFFAMEFVKGVPLTTYAKEKKLGTRQRLELLAKIADAVQHAHQKGIIHRDLKPGNILVTDAGQVKVLDFGVARATDGDMQSTTMQTDIGQLVGTIPYMSPEQAAGDPDELDTRSDVYALGVVAYELLAGRLPYDIGQKLVHEAVRVIREDDPTPLSSIDRTFRGDVEIIISKALEKEKERRYQSASDLASDIHRYLHDEPIVARAPSSWYQLQKFTKRNKVLVGGVAAVMLVLVLGIAVSTMFAAGEARQRKLADAATTTAQEQEQIAKDEAERSRIEAEKSKRTAEFITDMLTKMDPAEAQGKDTELLGIMLADASERVGTDLKGAPEIEATIRNTIGNVYRSLGLYEKAEPHLTEALKIRKRILGDEDPDTLTSMGNLAVLYLNQGRYGEAESLSLKALKISKRVQGEEHPDTLATMSNLVAVYYRQGRYDEAEPLLVKALEIQKRVLGEEHPDTLTSMNNLAELYYDQGRYDEVEPLNLKALEIDKRVLGEEHPNTLTSMNNLVTLYYYQGRYDEAEPLLVKALEIQKRVLGEEHPDTLTSMNNLAELYVIQGRYAEAEPLLLKTLEISKRVRGKEHPDTLSSMGNLAGLYLYQGRYGEAEPLFLKALEIQKRVLGEEHPGTLPTMNKLAMLYYNQGRYDEAEPLFLSVYHGVRDKLGEEHPDTGRVLHYLANVYGKQNHPEISIALWKEHISKLREVIPADDPRLASALIQYGMLLVENGKAEDAEPVLRECLAIREKALVNTKNDWLIANTRSVLGGCLTKLDRFAQAEPLLTTSAEALEKNDNAPADRKAQAIQRVVDLYAAWDAAEPAQGHAAKADPWRAKLPKPDTNTEENAKEDTDKSTDKNTDKNTEEDTDKKPEESTDDSAGGG